MAKMMKVLVGEPDNMVERFYGEIGNFTCTEPEAGGYSCKGDAPRGPGGTPMGARGGSNNPVLSSLAEKLKTASKEGIEQAQANAEASS